MADSPLAHSETLDARSVPPEADAPRFERLVPGTRAGSYEVEKFLGHGAMGEVYAAREPVIAKRVAIKVMRGELLPDPDAAMRLFREARAANHVDHPNVVDVFTWGKLDDGRLWLGMDLVDGRTLRAAIRDRSLDVAGSLDVLAQIADALDAAHARGVVHRDLKPDNVMISERPGARPRVHVLDFGLAKIVQAGAPMTGNGSMTGRGTWIGTPGYMAPEQWSADGAGPASDRYALGVMAFEMLSGQLPFQAPSLPAMMEQHFRAEVPALSARGAIGVNARLDPVLARAMAKNPEERFATATELVQALRDASAGKAVAGLRPARRAWVPAAAGAGVLAATVAGVVLVRSGGTDQDGDGRAENPNVHREANDPVPSNQVRLNVTSEPSGAKIRRGKHDVGMTPAALQVAPDERVALELRKPGYRTADRAVDKAKAGDTLSVRLEPITGFEGVWVLPSGQLRAFSRADEAVIIHKLDSVDGERTFYRRFEIVEGPAELAQGMAFAADDTLTDDRFPQDPSCQIRHRVEYHYDAAQDRLEVQPEDVRTDVQRGRCVVKARRKGKALQLVRADREGDERWTTAPVGTPQQRDRLAAEQRRKDAQKKSELVKKPPPPAPNDDPKGKELSKEPAKDPKQTTVKQPPPPAQKPSRETNPLPGKKAGKAAVLPLEKDEDQVQAQAQVPIEPPPAQTKVPPPPPPSGNPEQAVGSRPALKGKAPASQGSLPPQALQKK
ncbi:MAG: serine/threonine protein kinase [Deltaproteobacteria bacterium]|nr:serine/threonine protein kinase [Deltaproteobacteria bacterium]